MDAGESYRRSVESWLATAGGVKDWAVATPCSEWNVRDLVNHVVGEDRWTRPLVEGRTIAEVGDSLSGDLLGDDPAGAVRAAADEALGSVGDRLAGGGVVHLSYGDEDLEEYVRQLTADHLIHAWDLAAATGQDRTMDADVVSDVAAWFADRESLYRSAGIVGERPAHAVGGSPQADLLIAAGRDPDWTR
jgi:uncharacterized protein (TIGR03086 family)